MIIIKSIKLSGIKKSRKFLNRLNFKKIIKIILINFIIVVLIVSVILAFGIKLLKGKISKINYLNLNKDELGANENIYNEIENLDKNIEEITIIALFGVDSRNSEDMYKDSRSDSIMIFSINSKNKNIKLISIPRDTYVSIPGYGNKKINAAFSYGKEQLAIKTINENFGLNISEFITIDFSGLVKIIDELGGIDLTISEEEMRFINKAINYTAKHSGGDNSKLTQFGLVHLNGTQVLTHCRNRSVGNYDFKRTERQREVISCVIKKVLEKDIFQINSLVDLFLPCVTTNINTSKYIKYLPVIMNYKNKYENNIISVQIPSSNYASGQYIDGIYYFVCDKEKAREEMFNLLYKN